MDAKSTQRHQNRKNTGIRKIMKLWYVNIWLNPETGYDNKYRYEFTLHTRFISNYFSKGMRKKRIGLKLMELST
jgi:hypothetical protein